MLHLVYAIHVKMGAHVIQSLKNVNAQIIIGDVNVQNVILEIITYN
jgi:hypothetical protein